MSSHAKLNSIPQKTILVTGASSGIGRACALELDKAGFRVLAGVRKEKDAVSLKKAGSDALTPVFLDVTDQQSIDTAVMTATNIIGEAGLAGLVNNAGVGIPGPLEFISIDDLRRQLEINVVGQIAVTQACLPLIRKARGRIINIGSVGGKITIPFGGALGASKYAIESLNDALRMELYPWGIPVVLVAPGAISTPAVDKMVLDSEAIIREFSSTAAELYGHTFRRFVQTAVATEKAGSQPGVVAKVVKHALTTKTPKLRYPVGANSTLLTLLPKVLPNRLLDKVRFKIFGLPQKFGALLMPHVKH